ncbi:hypothetical protein LUZ60_014072 [Juncus effusus]|nr:hypothetical protein LUZ60_014072 [Juncus effusus]
MAPARRKKTSAAAAAAAAAQWKVGDLVLAKMKGFPAWPAMISEPEKWGLSSVKKKILVYFYGTKQIAFCNYADLEAFTEEKKKTILSKRHGKGSDFVRAVEEIVAIYEDLKKQNQNDIISGTDPQNNPTDEVPNGFIQEEAQSSSLYSNKINIHINNNINEQNCVVNSVSDEPIERVSSILDELRQAPFSTSITTKKRNRDSQPQSPNPNSNPNPNSSKRTRLQRLSSFTSDKSAENEPFSSKINGKILESSPIITDASESETLEKEAGSSTGTAEPDLPPKTAFFKRKRRPNRKRASSTSNGLEYNNEKINQETLLNSLKRQNSSELAKESYNESEPDSPNNSNSRSNNEVNNKSDGDEHLPLVKRARVRMERSLNEESKPNGDLDFFMINPKPNEAALPPSKRLHRALEAMSANVAETKTVETSVGTINLVPNGRVVLESPKLHTLDNPDVKVSSGKSLLESPKLHQLDSQEVKPFIKPDLESSSSKLLELASSETKPSEKTKLESLNLDSFVSEVKVTEKPVLERPNLHTLISEVKISETPALENPNLDTMVSDVKLSEKPTLENPNLGALISEVKITGKPVLESPKLPKPASPEAKPSKTALEISELESKPLSTVSDEIRKKVPQSVPELPIPIVKTDQSDVLAKIEPHLAEKSDVKADSSSKKDVIMAESAPSTSNFDADTKQYVLLTESDPNVKNTDADMKRDAIMDGSALHVGFTSVQSGSNNAQAGERHSSPMKHVTTQKTFSFEPKRFLPSKNLLEEQPPFPEPSGISSTQHNQPSPFQNPITVPRQHENQPFPFQNPTTALPRQHENQPSPFQNPATALPRQHETRAPTVVSSSVAHAARKAFEAFILTLTRTKESIGRATRLAMECAKYGNAGEVMDVIIETLERESNLHKRVDFFFLVDSITQWSRGQKGGTGDVYISLVQSVLPRLLCSVAPPGISAWDNRKHCLKVLKLWLERKTLPEYMVQKHIRELESMNDASFSTSSLRRPQRTERPLNDPAREMEGMLVDEYGSNASFQLPPEFRSTLLEASDDEQPASSSSSEEKIFEAVTPEHDPHISPETNNTTNQTTHTHHTLVLAEVDGELEMEDVAPSETVEKGAEMLGTRSVFTPPLPEDQPPSPPPLPASPPPPPPGSNISYNAQSQQPGASQSVQYYNSGYRAPPPPPPPQPHVNNFHIPNNNNSNSNNNNFGQPINQPPLHNNNNNNNCNNNNNNKGYQHMAPPQPPPPAYSAYPQYPYPESPYRRDNRAFRPQPEGSTGQYGPPRTECGPGPCQGWSMPPRASNAYPPPTRPHVDSPASNGSAGHGFTILSGRTPIEIIIDSGKRGCRLVYIYLFLYIFFFIPCFFSEMRNRNETRWCRF